MVDGDSVLFKDYIKARRAIINPNHKPIFVALSHLTLTVKAPPPTKLQRTILAQGMSLLNMVRPNKPKLESVKIIDDISFYLRPLQMTLVLGAPGNAANSHKLLFCKQGNW